MYYSRKIPKSAKISSAKLLFLTSDPSASDISLNALKLPFTATSTWKSLENGVSPGFEAEAYTEFTVFPNNANVLVIFDVSTSIQAIVNGR